MLCTCCNMKKMCGLGSPGGYTAAPTEVEDSSGGVPLMPQPTEPDEVCGNEKKMWGFDLPGGYRWRSVCCSTMPQLMLGLTCTQVAVQGSTERPKRHGIHRHSPDQMIHRSILMNHANNRTEETLN
jgi:hypothetical protein